MGEANVHEALHKVRQWLRLHRFPPLVRKAIVAVLGGICLGAGVVMIVTPGPALLFMPLGLLMLASEFQWAERWAHKAHAVIHRIGERWQQFRKRRVKKPPED